MKNMAKVLMGLGWKLREGQKLGPQGLQFAFALVFLLLSAVIFRLRKDYYGYAESIDHIVYWLKMFPLGGNRLAVFLAEYALCIMRDHRPEKRAAALRAVISMYMEVGNFQYALELIEEYLAFPTSPLDRADLRTHKAACLRMLGYSKDALFTVNDAIVVLEHTPKESQTYIWAVWFTKALLVKAHILYDKRDCVMAKQFAEMALEYAKWHKANARIREATKLLEVMAQVSNP